MEIQVDQLDLNWLLVALDHSIV